MPKVKDKSRELEVLIATMNKTSLDFLSNMFLSQSYSNLTLLIVNQTTKDKLLVSNFANIRVINSFEKGLSKSRNLAIKNAIKPICLLTDDDVIFLKGFEDVVLNAHQKYYNPIITFQTNTTNGALYWKYPIKEIKHNNYITRKTLSIEISFKKNKLIGANFNQRFGLGSQFEDAENYIFLNELKKQGFQHMFINKSIGIHKPLSSSDEVASDRFIYARGALNAYKYGNLAYFWVLKFVFFLVRKNLISFHEMKNKITLGFKGINDYKN
ncbi:MAG: glycosyltransferase family 2 protein [Flavobacteriaceae bacterium]|jgi:hypothetical protein|nr:glycosyltransferase family 2 protein [Flavobacteriaceae bacterium]MBT6704427.1 glycosyltransferase family 2 protein [Flavobacteriaceae bacterium]MBT7242945.1 glycosyltransferase family 2 protein [Flavobacteriaceae bacterium]